LIGIVHAGQLAKDVTRMNELVPEANLPARASQVIPNLLQPKIVPINVLEPESAFVVFMLSCLFITVITVQ
jgi:hypothetical protein